MKIVLCPACESGDHTAPGLNVPIFRQPSSVCQCGERTCACYGIQVAAGVRKGGR